MAQLAKTSVPYVKFDRLKTHRDLHFALLEMAITVRLVNVNFLPYGPRIFVLANECTVVRASREGRRVCVALDVQP